MKTINTFRLTICSAIAGFVILSSVQGQDVKERLHEANAAYKAGNLHDARFAMQQALSEIDKAIGTEILKVMPLKLGNWAATISNDQITGTSYGTAGLYVRRFYGDEQSNVDLQIIGDSPLLAGINAMLAMPVFVADPSMKKIKVGAYRAILQKSTVDSGVTSWEVNMPFGSSLLTARFRNIVEEKQVLDLMNQIPVDKIALLLQ